MGCTGMAWHTLSPAQQADYEKKNPFQVPARTSTSAPLARPRERLASGGALRLGCSAPASGGPVPDSPAPRRTPSPAALLHPPGPASPIRLGPSPLGSRRPQLAQSQGAAAQPLAPSRPRPMRRRPILVKSRPRFLVSNFSLHSLLNFSPNP